MYGKKTKSLSLLPFAVIFFLLPDNKAFYMKLLEGKVAIVTGAARGTGEGIILNL